MENTCKVSANITIRFFSSRTRSGSLQYDYWVKQNNNNKKKNDDKNANKMVQLYINILYKCAKNIKHLWVNLSNFTPKIK